MRLLLDTHILLWWLQDDAKLPNRLRSILEESGDELFLSSVSVFEIATKVRIGKLKLDDSVVNTISAIRARAGLSDLPLDSRHSIIAGALPLHHRDPFDRLLVAQAIVEGMTLMSCDPTLARYSVPILAS